MMKPTEDRAGDELTEPLDWSMSWRIFAHRQVRSRSVVIGSIGFQDSAQMVLAQDHDVIQALPTDRADQPLGMARSATVSAARSGDPGYPSLKDVV
jgi:hypothetical protein